MATAAEAASTAAAFLERPKGMIDEHTETKSVCIGL
jgi:hypothetical protein